MTITRTVIAWCDDDRCTASVLLDPDNPQPWLGLTDLGWVVDPEVADPLTYCPDHALSH